MSFHRILPLATTRWTSSDWMVLSNAKTLMIKIWTSSPWPIHYPTDGYWAEDSGKLTVSNSSSGLSSHLHRELRAEQREREWPEANNKRMFFTSITGNNDSTVFDRGHWQVALFPEQLGGKLTRGTPTKITHFRADSRIIAALLTALGTSKAACWL